MSSDDRRSEIVSAMFETIKKSGVNLPSFEQISRSGGTTRQLIRHYYSDVEEVALELCNKLTAEYRDRLMKAILDSDQKNRLPVFLDFYFDFLAEKEISKPRDDEVYDALFAYASGSKKVRKNLHDQYALLQMTLAHEIQLAYPTLPQERCNELGFMIVTTMYGHWKMVASLGFSEEYNKVSRGSLDHLISSYVEKYATS